MSVFFVCVFLKCKCFLQLIIYVDDYEGMEKEVVDVVFVFVKNYFKVKVIVLECINMLLFIYVVEKVIGLRVWDVLIFGKWFYVGVVFKDYRV